VVQRALTALVPSAVLVGVAWSSGGYFARTWGALLLLVAIGLAAVGILQTSVELESRAVVVAGALVALAAWQLVTTAWAVAPDEPVLEAERTLVYAGAATLAFLTVSRARAPDLVVSVLLGAGAATAGGLLQHGLGSGEPDDRLALPVGYANAAGILAATALVLGLGLATSASALRRAVGGAFAVPAAAGLALSLSRGSILAAALGVLVLCIAIASLRGLAATGLVALPAAGAVAAVSLGGGLGDRGAAPRELLALLAVAGLSLIGAGLAVRVSPARRADSGSTHRPPRARALVVGACAFGAVALLAAAVYEVAQSRSGPTTLESPPNRLLSTSTSSRGDYWLVAARMVEDDPLGGGGAGGFTRVWLRERPTLLFVRDAHNLYLETLAELGPVGLGLLLVALVTPLLRAPRVTRSAAGRGAIAAYVALVAHASLDWDWELPAVTLCTVLLAVALVRLGGTVVPRALATTGRVALLACATLLAALAVVVHAGNGATADANDLLDRGRATQARDAAERARRYRPWAAEPWQLLGEAELAEGQAAAAREHLRRATREDAGSWSAWLSLGLSSSGRERMQALARARALNPLAPEVEALADANPSIEGSTLSPAGR
jgi:hypothetical protein